MEPRKLVSEEWSERSRLSFYIHNEARELLLTEDRMSSLEVLVMKKSFLVGKSYND
jgi:hypothetical protein